MPEKTSIVQGTTLDGKIVKEGDTVWVLDSLMKPCKTTVLEPVTNYELFGPIPVSQSFSSKKEAIKYRDGL